MSGLDVVVLGSSSGTPTRERNHGGYLVRLGSRHVLFDPGEGTQRQLIHAGVSAARIDVVAITHFHGDHCLGLPGMLSRLDVDRQGRDVEVAFPASGADSFHKLATGDLHQRTLTAHARPVDEAAASAEAVAVTSIGDWTLTAQTLDHRVPCVGYRLAEPPRRRFDGDALVAAGIQGADVGRLRARGELDVDGRTVTLDDVSAVAPGRSVAFVMDTRACANAVELARGVDLLVIEATYADEHADLADRHAHLTARQAARIGAEAGARRVVLTHVSPRYGDVGVLLAEAREEHPDVVFPADLETVAAPR